MKNEYAAVKDTASDTENGFPSKGGKENRISGLDGLRTLAITGVTLFHMFPQTIRGGWLGVSLFFCTDRLSSGLYERKEQNQPFLFPPVLYMEKN